MFDGNWGGFRKAVAALFGLVLGSLIVVWLFESGASTALSRYEQERHSSHYAVRAQQDIEQRCLVLDPPAMAECIRELVEATNEHQRAQEHLIAQLDTALWTFWLAVISGAFVGITAVGVWYVALTLREARKTTRAAIRTTVQGGLAVKEAKETNRIQSEIGFTETRAWVAINCRLHGKPTIEGGNFKFAIWIQPENLGKSPAINLSLIFEHQRITETANTQKDVLAKLAFLSRHPVLEGEAIFPGQKLGEQLRYVSIPLGDDPIMVVEFYVCCRQQRFFYKGTPYPRSVQTFAR